MMNDQQIGIQDRGSRSLNNFPLELPNAKGFSSQKPVPLAVEGGTASQSLRAPPLSETSSSHFESRTDCLNFPGFEQHDHSIPSWAQASEMGSSVYVNQRPLEIADSALKNYVTFQSRDTLQSLVQSSFCHNQNTQSFEEDSGYQISNMPEEKHVEFQQNQPAVNKFRDWRHYHSISFRKNLQVENYSFESKDLLPCKFQVENEAIDYSKGFISPISTNASERAAMTKRNRIRWTQELHNQFIDCVNRLGGAKKATPKGIFKLMNCDGLTIFHIKSHLQKYLFAQYITEAKEDVEKTGTSSSPELDPEMSMKILEALKMQIDVQRRLYEQLECQKNLQLRIEEQGQQLKKMFDLQVETNIKPNKDAN